MTKISSEGKIKLILIKDMSAIRRHAVHKSDNLSCRMGCLSFLF